MGKCKSLLPKQNDPVECTTCGDTFARKYTDSHWRKHQTKLPIHSEDIPISQRVVTVKPKSNLTNLWSKSNTPKIKTKKQTNDMKYETGRNILCVLHEASENMQQVQPTLIDIYNKIESDLHEKEDKRLSAGYCREMFDVLLPVCIVAQIESFCMNFGYEEPIYNDLGGVLLRYGRSDNVNLRTALNFWKNKMNES
eukprot:330420_1